MSRSNIHAVTGGFGFSGRYIVRQLLEKGKKVLVLTNSPARENPFQGRVEVSPYHFDRPEKLVGALQGVSVLYNTYWVRFNHRRFTHHGAVENTRSLFQAARTAGVRHIVHTSITNPALDSPFEYFHGKARLEAELVESGMEHTILRPAVIFGREDILINNIAWTLRNFPIFAIAGDGAYHIRPIFVEDFARLAVSCGLSGKKGILDAVGPENYEYRELVAAIAGALGLKRRIIHLPSPLVYIAARLIGLVQGDIFLTWEEIGALTANLLDSDAPSAGTTGLGPWLKENSEWLGRRYHSELRRRENRRLPYREL